jgi:putative flavoprotein involved in K+ transport
VPACIRDARALFFGSRRDVCALAELKMNRMLDTCDAWAQQHRVDGEVGPVERLSTTEIGASPRRGRLPRGSMCLPGLRRCKSNCVHGAEHDVRELAAHRGDLLGGTNAWPMSLAATPTGPVAAG